MAAYAKIAFKLLKNKKTRRIIIIGLLLFNLITSVVPVTVGATAIYAVKTAGEKIISFVIDRAEDFSEFFKSDSENSASDLADNIHSKMDEDLMLKAYDKGFQLDSQTEAMLRMKNDDFKHLLERVSEYNHAGERTRDISVEYEVKTWVDDDEGGHYETDNGYMDVTVDNSQYEGLYKVNWRLIYYYCVLSVCDKKEADKVLKAITPLDKDFNEITEFNNTTNADDVNYISSERIDRVFTYCTTQFNYDYDVLRNEKDEYTMSEALTLPHRTDTWNDGDDEYTMYVPQSYLRYGSSAYSYISNEMEGRTLTGTKEHFNYDSFVNYAKQLFPNLTEDIIKMTFEFGEYGDLYETIKGYGEDTVVAEKNNLAIKVNGTSGTASFKGLSKLSEEKIEILTYIYNKMLEWGWTPEMAAGACGNAWQESWFSLNAGENGSAHGIFQWQEGRWYGANGLQKFAEQQGKAWNTVEVQTDYLYKELTTEGYLSRIEQYLSQYYNGATTTTIDDIDAATDAFCVIYEGCYCEKDGSVLKSHIKGHDNTCARDIKGKLWQNLQLRRDYAKAIYDAMSLRSIDAESKLSEEDIDRIMNLMPDDLSEERMNIVQYAMSSVGRIPYYYGDSTSKPGYDNQRFGQAAAASDAYYEKNATKGRYIHGLDCSGWISWVYLSTIDRPYMGDTSTLAGVGRSVRTEQMKPGDILNKAGNHVVMYLGRNTDGTLVVIHENASAGNVSVSWNWKNSDYEPRNILGD